MGVWNFVSSDQFGEQTAAHIGKGGFKGITLSPQHVKEWINLFPIAAYVSDTLEHIYAAHLNKLGEEGEKRPKHREEGCSRRKADKEDCERGLGRSSQSILIHSMTTMIVYTTLSQGKLHFMKSKLQMLTDLET